MPSQFRRASSVLLALSLLCGTGSAVSAEVVARKSFSFFDVKGNTADELDAALNTLGPEAAGATSHHPAATRIRFGGEATYVERGGRCYIGGVRVTVDTEIILPRWRDRRHAEKRLSAVWEMLLADIKRHEARHVEIARDHAHRMEHAILALGSQADCDRLQDKVSRTTEHAISLHDRDQARFDAVEAANFENRVRRLSYNKTATQKTGK